jgi:hypothetical protein
VVEGDAASEFILEDVAIDSASAFFVVSNRGIKDNMFKASVYSSSKFNITRVEFYEGDVLVHEKTDMSTPIVIFPLQDISDTAREIKMIAYGIMDGDTEETSYEYIEDVKDYATITGDVSISFDPDTGKHTAAVNIDNPGDLKEILWQIVYHSTVVEKVVKVTDATQKALINIIYQNYAGPTETEIEFEALGPGNYSVVAYLINDAGVFFKAQEYLFVPGGEGDDEDLVVGDSITVGCISNHGEVPIMSIYRLSRDGFIEDVVVPMNHAFERTYFYDYTIEEPDSFYIFRTADSVLVKKVGIPRGCTIAYSKKKNSGRTIPYSLLDFNGNEVSSGVLDDTGFGVYYKVLPENSHGVLSIGNTFKVI